MNEVEQVKERLDIAEVIGGYIPLKQAGRNLKAPCPFHHEKTASFMVSPEKGIYHCFGCQEGGDVISFVMKYEGLDFPQALELLARRAGIELKPRRIGQDKKTKAEAERLQQAVALAAKYYQATLIRNQTALTYATQKRKLNKQSIKDFMIGYAPDSWDALGQFLKKKGFNASELKRAGLVGQKEGRSNTYDLYRGRLMFTISDSLGNPVGFTGRVLDDEQVPKYLNTPQTTLYDKSRIIFGLHLAKNAIRENNEVVLVEGNMDVVSSHQAGVKQVVAVSGTALTREQLKALSNLTKNIKLAFDMDKAGRAAIDRAIPLAQPLGVTLSIVNLSGKDPDDMINDDMKSWTQAIAEAKEVREYFREKYKSEYDLGSPLGQIKYAKEMASILRLYFKDTTSQDDKFGQLVYISHIAKDTGLPEQEVKDIVINSKYNEEPSAGRSPHTAQKSATQVDLTDVQKKTAKQLLEESVLAINLAFPEVRLSIEDLTPAHFTDERHQVILEVLQRAGREPALTVARQLPNLEEYVKIITLRGEENYDSFAPADRSFEAFQLVGRLQIATNQDTQKKLSQKLRAAEEKGDAELAKRLLAQFQTLITEED